MLHSTILCSWCLKIIVMLLDIESSCSQIELLLVKLVTSLLETFYSVKAFLCVYLRFQYIYLL